MPMKYQLLAAAEVLGRQMFGRTPWIRKLAHRSVRRQAQISNKVTLQELLDTVAGLGVTRADILMVHSAWDGMRQLDARPSDVVRLLLSMIGESGTLIMPTSPIYAERDSLKVYDVVRSPSALGLLSECFRRFPGTVRSLFPMATVSAIGPSANHFTRDYRVQSSNTPYGFGSPYWEMGERRGKVLVMGVDTVRTLTLQHCAFDILGDDNPVADFYTDVSFVVTHSGAEETWTIRRPRYDLVNYLATVTFAKMIDSSGTFRRANLNGINIVLVDAHSFLQWHLPLAKSRGWPYWGFRKTKVKFKQIDRKS